MKAINRLFTNILFSALLLFVLTSCEKNTVYADEYIQNGTTMEEQVSEVELGLHQLEIANIVQNTIGGNSYNDAQQVENACGDIHGSTILLELDGYYEIEYIEFAFCKADQNYKINLQTDVAVNKSTTDFKEVKATVYQDLNWEAYNGNITDTQTIEFKSTYGKSLKINAVDSEGHVVSISYLKVYGTKL